MSLYFYIDAACIDLQHVFNQMRILQIELVDNSKNSWKKIIKANSRKMHIIEAVLLHRDITKYLP